MIFKRKNTLNYVAMLCVIAAFFSPTSAWAQDTSDEKLARIREIATGEDEPQYHHMIGANVLALAWQTISIRTQHAINPSLAFVTGGTYLWPGGVWNLPFQAIGLEAGVSWYPGARVLHGFFLEPKIGVQYIGSIESDISIFTPAISGLFGYSWVFGRAVQMSLGLGLNYQFIFAQNNASNLTNTWNGFLPTGQFSLGYVF